MGRKLISDHLVSFSNMKVILSFSQESVRRNVQFKKNSHDPTVPYRQGKLAKIGHARTAKGKLQNCR